MLVPNILELMVAPNKDKFKDNAQKNHSSMFDG